MKSGYPKVLILMSVCYNLMISSQLQKLLNSDSSWVSSQSNGFSPHPSWLQLYLYACKLLDMAIALPAESLPQFQMYRWAFVGDSSDEDEFYSSLLTPDQPHPPRPATVTSLIVDEIKTKGGNRSPSPTPTRNSSGLKSAVSSPIPPAPFEPHVIRIEKIMRSKVCLISNCFLSCLQLLLSDDRIRRHK